MSPIPFRRNKAIRCWRLFTCLILLVAAREAHADAIDDAASAQGALDALKVTAVAKRWDDPSSSAQFDVLEKFGKTLHSAEARTLWMKVLGGLSDATGDLSATAVIGRIQGTLRQVFALEMLAANHDGDTGAVRKWRDAMKRPTQADVRQGQAPLESANRVLSQRVETTEALAREAVIWLSVRAREQSDDLLRLAKSGSATPESVALCAAEANTLAQFPRALLAAANIPAMNPTTLGIPYSSPDSIARWRSDLESQLPVLPLIKQSNTAEPQNR